MSGVTPTNGIKQLVSKTIVIGAVGLGLGFGLTACTATADGPDGSSEIKISVPDISMPKIDIKEDAGSGGGSGSGGGDSSGGDANSGSSGGSSSGGSGGDSSSGSGSDSSGGSSQGASSSQDNGMGPLGWAVVIIGIIAVIALIASGSNSAQDQQAAADDRRRRRGRQLQSIIQNARWAESQASQALTIKDSRQLQSAWSQARTYMPSIESNAAGLAADEGHSDLASAVGAMGQAVASLRGAMDNYVQVRTSSGIDDASSKSAEQNVRQTMSQLDHDLQQVNDLAVARGS